MRGYQTEKQDGRRKFRNWLATNLEVAEELEEKIRVRIGRSVFEDGV